MVLNEQRKSWSRWASLLRLANSVIDVGVPLVKVYEIGRPPMSSARLIVFPVTLPRMMVKPLFTLCAPVTYDMAKRELN